MHRPRHLHWALVVAALMGLTLLAVGCATSTPQTIEVTREVVVEKKVIETVEVIKEVPVEVIKEVTVEVPVEVEPAVRAPFEELWAESGHADAEAEAFIHWDEDDPAVVGTSCAKCHSEGGYLDFLGVDGSAAGVVDTEAAIGTTVTCIACHNAATAAKDSVVMPSGLEISGLGPEARCMECHQGRESAVSVSAAIEGAGVDDDATSEDLGFLNIHYFAAAATKYGTMAKGGYEYEGKMYDGNFGHVVEFDSCVECHSPHTLEVQVDECAECHSGVAAAEDLREVRMPASLVDYDGDGDVAEGLFYELEGAREVLYGAMQAYAADVVGAAVAYDSHAYPYFFIDTNGNGEADEDEANYGNQYASWTPRLLRAAYNYQVSVKDPGAYAHGGKYIIQLLFDSIEDLNADLAAGLTRNDPGHFAGSEEAWRYWDEDGEVSSSCAKCHSSGGLPLYLEEGVNITEPLSNGMQCTTCHDALPEFTRYPVDEVEFPSGSTVSFGEGDDSNLCLNCHQGRESTVSVNGRIGDAEADAVTEGLSFANVHYFAAGASIFGTEAQGAYEYEGQTYNGRFGHVPGFDTCVACHDTHGLTVKEESCATCHAGAESVEDIRMSTADYDGDGDTAEGMAGEIETVVDALYAAIQEYAADVAEAPLVYDSHAYPYFFGDSNANGEPDPDEANYGNSYKSWTPRLLRAAYNYQYAHKDPGGFAHNGKYVLQVLYDSLMDVGGDVSGMTRP